MVLQTALVEAVGAPHIRQEIDGSEVGGGCGDATPKAEGEGKRESNSGRMGEGGERLCADLGWGMIKL